MPSKGQGQGWVFNIIFHFPLCLILLLFFMLCVFSFTYTEVSDCNFCEWRDWVVLTHWNFFLLFFAGYVLNFFWGYVLDWFYGFVLECFSDSFSDFLGLNARLVSPLRITKALSKKTPKMRPSQPTLVTPKLIFIHMH